MDAFAPFVDSEELNGESSQYDLNGLQYNFLQQENSTEAFDSWFNHPNNNFSQASIDSLPGTNPKLTIAGVDNSQLLFDRIERVSTGDVQKFLDQSPRHASTARYDVRHAVYRYLPLVARLRLTAAFGVVPSFPIGTSVRTHAFYPCQEPIWPWKVLYF
jgi:hypothetical protein